MFWQVLSLSLIHIYPVYGARPLKRYLQNYVETLAAKKILSGDVHQGDTLVLDVKDGEFVINTK